YTVRDLAISFGCHPTSDELRAAGREACRQMLGHRRSTVWQAASADYEGTIHDMDKHTLALISIVGSSLDVLGALYLAYDLLGGDHGPLRTLTRAVTYGILFGAGYGLAGGPVLGVSSGIAHGLTLGWEYSRASRQLPKEGVWLDAAVSAIRGLGFGLGTAYSFGARFGITFGLLSTVGQLFAYQVGIRPGVDYKPATRPRLSRFQLLAAVNRTAGYAVAGYVSSLVAHQQDRAVAVGLKAGLVVGLVTAVVGACSPFIEWTADHLPARRMGMAGVILILIGFGLQSIQYWAILLNVPIR
ncbi:MAG TPA: hypothetical protein VI756_04910, partial [Blastocatellia bacterium]